MEKSKIKNKAIKPAAKQPEAKLKAKEGCVIIESLTNKHMVKGKQYSVTKEIAEVLIKQKKAVLCK